MRLNLFRSKRTNRVTMVNSVAHLEGGKTYDLPAEEADVLLIKGYAAGELSRVWAPAERAIIESQAARNQLVTMDWDRAKLVMPGSIMLPDGSVR